MQGVTAPQEWEQPAALCGFENALESAQCLCGYTGVDWPTVVCDRRGGQ
jgi:hypothetical protein